jgi:hypothetical protein
MNFDLPPTADITAALERGDYAWMVEHIFIPALVDFIREQETAALVKGPRPRSRRLAGSGLRRGSPRCRKAAARHSPPQGDSEVPA